jgi:hypothetical protein
VLRHLHSASDRATAWLVFALLLVIGGCWVVLTPPGAGADEPSHLIRVGAVIHGDFSGLFVTDLEPEVHELSGRYIPPEPGCYVHAPDPLATPVDCAAGTDPGDETVSATTTADNYPIWGHLVVGIPTLIPLGDAIWSARIGGVLVAVGLVAAAMARARQLGRLAGAGILVAMTPMAWGTFATVNPSTVSIAGAIAVWIALLIPQQRPDTQRITTDWLLVAGWAALALPRRDGLIWATLIASIVTLSYGISPLELWRRSSRTQRVALGVITAIVVVWGITNKSNLSRLVALSPLLLVGVEFGRRAWFRFTTSPSRRLVAITVLAGLAVLAALAAIKIRPGGYSPNLTGTIISETGRHLTEAIGVLGWLDAPLPWFAIAGVVLLVGVFAGATIVGPSRPGIIAVGVLAAAVLSSWVFELQEGSTYGRYWQGRYSLPLLVGVPIVLATSLARSSEAPAGLRLARVGGFGALFIMNVAAWSAARRWGVGLYGSMMPWDWDTPLTPFPTMIVLAVLAVSSGSLATVILTRDT